MSDWVKRLGQWHIVSYTSNHPYLKSGTHTVCGMPLMGNNYAYDIPEDKRTKCPKCHGIGEERI